MSSFIQFRGIYGHFLVSKSTNLVHETYHCASKTPLKPMTTELRWYKLSFFVFLYIIYLAFGALVFQYYESAYEVKYIQGVFILMLSGCSGIGW